jgi:uncharacterized protein (TIGR03083 family)
MTSSASEMQALTNDVAIGAAERGMRQFCDLLATADRPDAPAIESWRVRDVGAHLTGIKAYAEMLRGTPSPAASIDGITDWNAANVAAAADDAVAAIADRVGEGFAEFVDEVRHHPSDELVGWHAGLPMPVSTLCVLVAGEAYIHGWDIARALGRPWRMEPDDMRTIFRGLLPVLPHYVDPGISPSFTATFDVRLRGGAGAQAAFVFDHGELDVRPSGAQRADCRVSADPAAFILIMYGRSGPLAPALRGRVVATGRKPWLGLSLPRRFRRP